MKNVVFRSEFKAPTKVLNWFPGHMRKAMRTFETEVKKASVFMEVRDARIPRTSHNAELAALLPPQLIISLFSEIHPTLESVITYGIILFFRFYALISSETMDRKRFALALLKNNK